MSKKEDIIDGSAAKNKRYGLIYTKKCGWVDLGHANPNSASALWRQIQFESGAVKGKDKFHYVTYLQKMSWKKQISFSVQETYRVKRGLTPDRKRSVALAIYMNVSIAFEQMQSSWPASLATNSGFSVEDLVSNLIGFYRATLPGTDYIGLCEPVSKDEALKIWDTYGSVESLKNHSFSPILFPLLKREYAAQSHPNAIRRALPDFLNTIRPSFSPDEVLRER